MLIAHLSDPHVTTGSTGLAALVDTPHRLRDALGVLAHLPQPPDLIVLTGDLVNDGLPGEYELLAEILNEAPCRVLPIPGNHDDPDLFRTCFQSETAIPASGPFHYSVDSYELRIVAVDTVVAGHHHGAITEESASWLHNQLLIAPEHPSIVMMHHAPYPTGAWWFDYNGVQGADLLREVLSQHHQVVRVIAGHVHQSSQTQWGSTVLSTAPSTAFLSGPGSPTATPTVRDELAATPLLRWTGAELLATTTPLPSVVSVLDLSKLSADWPAYEAKAKAGGPISKEEFGG